MMGGWGGAAVLCLLALPLATPRAQTVPVPVPAEPSTSPAPAIAFDPAKAHASFEVYLRAAMRAVGQFDRVSGQMQGSAAKGWVVLVAIDGTSLQFDGPAWMARISRSDPFLALDRHPDIRFASVPFPDAMLRSGGELHGELRLRGRARAVVFELLAAECARPGYDCDIAVRGRVSRHAFGMNTQRMMVRDEVDFRFRVRFLAPAHPDMESRP